MEMNNQFNSENPIDLTRTPEEGSSEKSYYHPGHGQSEQVGTIQIKSVVEQPVKEPVAFVDEKPAIIIPKEPVSPQILYIDEVLKGMGRGETKISYSWDQTLRALSN